MPEIKNICFGKNNAYRINKLKVDFLMEKTLIKIKIEIRKNSQKNFMRSNFPGGDFPGMSIFQGTFFPKGIFSRNIHHNSIFSTHVRRVFYSNK